MTFNENNVMDTPSLRFAVVCRHNVNRSVQVHRMMKVLGLDVRSFGTRKQINLPGSSPKEPSIKFSFGTPYTSIYNHLNELNCKYYKNNRVLEMLAQNIGTKDAPESFQSSDLEFDVIMTLDDTSFASVMKDISTRRSQENTSLMFILHMPVADELVHIRTASHHAAILAEAIQHKWHESIEELQQVVRTFNEIAEPDGYIATLKRVQPKCESFSAYDPSQDCSEEVYSCTEYVPSNCVQCQ